MSDYYDGGNAPNPTGELFALPPELRPLARRLDHDGANWRNALPDDFVLAQRVIARIAPPPQMTGTSMSLQDQDTRPTPSGTQPARPPSRNPRSGAGRGFIAAAAMLVVVVLLAMVLKTFVRPHVGTSTSTINTRTPVTTATPSFAGRWKVLSQFSGIPAPQPDDKNPSLVVAPSNPLIAYQVTFARSGSKSASISIQRTDDGGASWSRVALPTALSVDSNVAGVHLIISPLNPLYIFLSVDWFTPGCATYAQYGVCSGQYMSQDSGSGPWVSPYMPTSGDLWSLQVGDDSHLLYGTVYTPTYSSGASPANGLMVSDDGGMQWRAADSDLATAGLGISSSAASTSGPTVYAVTEPALPDPQHDPTYQLWRSDDAGVHWSHVGGAPSNMPGTLLASGGSQSILYFQQSSSPNQPSPQLTFSIDGGYTWNPVPLTGIDPLDPQGNTPPIVLNDGSLLATFRDGNDTRFFVWAPGSSWREVAPPVHLQSIASMWAVRDSNSGKTTLFALFNSGTKDSGVESCPLP